MLKSENTRPQFMNLDFLRIVFTFVIIGYHFIRQLGFWNESGGYAVEFFFVLSGFLLVYTFNPNISVLTFFKKKIIRFMPAIIVSGIAVSLWFGQFNSKLLNNIFLVPIAEQLPVLVAWYINVLVWVSLLYFTLFKYLSRPIACLIIGILTFLAINAMLASSLWLTNAHFGERGTFGYLINGGLLRGLAGMGFGCLLAQALLNHPQTNTSNPKTTFCYTLAEICILGWLIGAMYIRQIYVGPFALLIGFTVLIYLFVKKQGILSRILDKPYYSKIARYTLCIYLMQEVIVRQIFPYLLHQSAYNHLLRVHYILTSDVILFITTLVGIIVYYLIEKPITHYFNKQRQIPPYRKKQRM